MADEARIGSTTEPEALRERVRHTLGRLSRTGELPPLSATANAALAVARDPDASVEQLCRIIRTDLGLAARVLRVANSASLARRKPARTLSEAVVGIGFRETCNILVLASARRMYALKSPHGKALWDHALATAVAAEELAVVTGRIEPSLAFLPGLFHDIGRVAFYLADPAAFEVIHGLAAEGGESRQELETQWYGFDHAAAGFILAETWGLAFEQCDAIHRHHDPGAAGAGRALAELIEAADYLAWSIGFGTGAEPPSRAGVARLGLGAEDEEVCAERIRQAYARHTDMLTPER